MAVSPPIERVGWAADLLKAGGWPTTKENLTAVVAWERAEGGHNGNNAAWNPLNTTKPMPGAGNTGKQGNIKVYTSRAQGLEATVLTIRLSYYTAVVAALKAGNSANAVGAAVAASPWGTHGHTQTNSGILDLIASSRKQVEASGAATGSSSGAFGSLGEQLAAALAGLATGGTGGTSTNAGTTAALVSAGGPLAGPAPDTGLPRLPLSRPIKELTLYGKKLWGDITDAIVAGRLSASASEVTLLELTLEDPGHMLLASRLFVDATLGWGELELDLATLEANAGQAGAGGLKIGFTSAVVNVFRNNKGPILVANTSPSELIDVLVGSYKLVAEQTHQRPGLYVLGDVPEPAVTIDPVTGEETTNPDAEPGHAAESYWDAIQRFAKEEGFLAFEAAEVIYFGRPSWLVENLPARTLIYDPAGDTGTRGLLGITARRTEGDATGVDHTVELSIELDSELLGTARGWLPGSAVALLGLPTFDGRYLITGLEVDLVGGTASVTAVDPVDPEPEGPPDDSNGAAAASTDGTAAAAAGEAPPSPAGSPGASKAGWFHPTGHKGTNSHNFGQNRGDHIHAGIDISIAVGAPIYAARAGTLIASEGGHGGYGHLVKISHAGGWETRYAHLSRFASHKGAEVRGGQLIGYSGGAVGAVGAGNSQGPHLHYETRLNGVAKNPDDVLPPPYNPVVAPGRPPPE